MLVALMLLLVIVVRVPVAGVTGLVVQHVAAAEMTGLMGLTDLLTN